MLAISGRFCSGSTLFLLSLAGATLVLVCMILVPQGAGGKRSSINPKVNQGVVSDKDLSSVVSSLQSHEYSRHLRRASAILETTTCCQGTAAIDSMVYVAESDSCLAGFTCYQGAAVQYLPCPAVGDIQLLYDERIGNCNWPSQVKTCTSSCATGSPLTPEPSPGPTDTPTLEVAFEPFTISFSGDSAFPFRSTTDVSGTVQFEALEANGSRVRATIDMNNPSLVPLLHADILCGSPDEAPQIVTSLLSESHSVPYPLPSDETWFTYSVIMTDDNLFGGTCANDGGFPDPSLLGLMESLRAQRAFVNILTEEERFEASGFYEATRTFFIPSPAPVAPLTPEPSPGPTDTPTLEVAFEPFTISFSGDSAFPFRSTTDVSGTVQFEALEANGSRVRATIDMNNPSLVPLLHADILCGSPDEAPQIVTSFLSESHSVPYPLPSDETWFTYSVIMTDDNLFGGTCANDGGFPDPSLLGLMESLRAQRAFVNILTEEERFEASGFYEATRTFFVPSPAPVAPPIPVPEPTAMPIGTSTPAPIHLPSACCDNVVDGFVAYPGCLAGLQCYGGRVGQALECQIVGGIQMLYDESIGNCNWPSQMVGGCTSSCPDVAGDDDDDDSSTPSLSPMTTPTASPVIVESHLPTVIAPSSPAPTATGGINTCCEGLADGKVHYIALGPDCSRGVQCFNGSALQIQDCAIVGGIQMIYDASVGNCNWPQSVAGDCSIDENTCTI